MSAGRERPQPDPGGSPDEKPTRPSQAVDLSFDLAAGERVHITIEASQAADPSPSPGRYHVRIEHGPGTPPPLIQLGGRSPQLGRLPLPRPRLPEPLHRLWTRLTAWERPLPLVLFLLSVALYTFTHLYRLADFPIYFFSDEAVQTVLAADLVRDGLHDPQGHLFPTYFENEYLYNLSVSVYLQVLPYLIFGRSVVATRAVPALVTLTGAIALALILRDIFRTRLWWSAVLFLGVAPAWFLHSRTAFETTLMVSFFAWFLYFYLRYRAGEARYLYYAVVAAGLAFYSYSAGQIPLVVAILLLGLSDLRYHLQQRRTVARAAALALAIIGLPYLRFQLQHPGETSYHLRMLDSYWLRELPLAEKMRTFAGLYARGLSPGYWFFPNEHDLPRHIMKGYGHLMAWTLPLAALGLLVALRRVRSSPHRSLLLGLAAAPLGGTVVGVGITRVLLVLVPLTLLIVLGAEALARWAAARVGRPPVAVGLFIVLAALNLGMLRDALSNGPLWYRDYGLGGMQYGARQVFTAVEAHLQQNPQDTVLVSPTWANGTDLLLRFFLPQEPRVRLANAAAYSEHMQDLNEDLLFVLTPEEYADLQQDPKFSDVRVERTIPYPDGRPGFYFLRMRYSPQAAALFAAEEAERRKPVVESFTLDGQQVIVEHSAFDMGALEHLFDGDPFTLARTHDLNPAFLAITFPSPQPLRALNLTTGSMDFSLRVRLFADPQSDPETYEALFTGLPPDPAVTLSFEEGPDAVTRVEIQIQDLNGDEFANIHIREVSFE